MKLKITILGVSLIILALGLSGCSWLSKKHEKKDNVEFKISTVGKTKVTLENVNGKITAVKGDTIPVLTLKAEKIDMVKKKDLDKPLDYIHINIDTTGNSIKITSEYQNEKSYLGFSKHNVKINYELTIPDNMEVSFENTNGNIVLTGLNGITGVNVTNGNIKSEHVSGKSTYEITNGSLKGVVDSTKGIDVNIVNGKCELELNKTFTGSVKADVTNGKVTYTDLQFSNAKAEKRSFSGYIGNTEPELKIDVVNGKVIFIGK
jgi:hypothetical protein